MQTLSLAFVLATYELPDVCQCATQPGPIGGSLWTAQGGAPIWFGDAGVSNGEVAGAIQSVVVHPTNPNIMWIGAVNGGIWRTTNALAENVIWKPLTDFMPSLSIGALDLDPTDPTHSKLVAGLGSFSSDGGLGGSIHGILQSTDGGNTWIYLDGGGLFENKRVSGVLSRGNTIIASVDVTSDNLTSALGIYRSIDSGATFTQLSSPTSQPYGLPIGRAIKLVGDSSSPAVVYAAFRSQSGGAIGVYKSTDTGTTWSKISNATMDNLIATCDEGVRVSGTFGNIVTVAIQDSNNNQTPHLFLSNTGGTNWTDLGLPGATSGFFLDIGCVLADPNNTNYVYVTGVAPWRCDLSQPVGSRWAQLYGPFAATPPNEGTTNSSSPHSDGRQMAFDLGGDLILVCDGGIYLRTNPHNNNGGWSSINGNLQVGEIYAVSYDPLFQVCVAGTQDNGTQRQTSPGQLLWQVINNSDGGDVAVDTTTSPGFSIVYVSYQGFGGFSRLTYSSPVNLVSSHNPSLSVINGGAPLQGQYVTPVNLNAINAQRLVIAGANGVYESFDQGETITEIGPGVQCFHRLVYGGWFAGVANPDVLYVPTASGQVFVRTNANGILTNTPTAFPGLNPVDIAILSTNWRTVFVADSQSIYMSSNAGATWTNITGNLTGVGQLRSVRTSSANRSPSVLVGSDTGVYVSSAPNIGFWNKAGTNLPNAPIVDMDYNEAADALVAGSHGHGAWLITNASSQIFAPAPPAIGLQPQSQTVLIGATASFSVSVGGTPPFGFQWFKNGSNIPGVTNANLLIGLAQTTDNGGYTVRVTNGLNAVTSVVATLTVTGAAPTNCALCAPSGLISWWTGDGTVNDRVGTNHGTLRNGTSYAPGIVGEAFSLDGVDDYISVSDSGAWAFGTNNFAIELWANFSAVGNNHIAFVANDEGGGLKNKWIFWRNFSGVLQLQINYPTGGGSVGSAAFSPILNQWYHLAVTRNGSTFTFYVNGSAVSTNVSTINIPDPNAPLTIGQAEGTFNFNGLLDETRIYNRALFASEIQAIYQAGTNGMCPPTPLMLTGTPQFSKTNGFVLNASLRSGQSYHFQANTNLATTNWISLTNFVAGTAPVFQYTNKSATNIARQFYRIVSP